MKGASPTGAHYFRPQTIQDVVDQTVNRALDLLDTELPSDLLPLWSGRAQRS